MHCVRKVKDDIFWVGGNDRRLAMFEGVYDVPAGVSYNSYMLLDEKTVLFDTVDKAVSNIFIENISYVLGERPLDYIVIHHMEPDHSASLMAVLNMYPDAKVIGNTKSIAMINQFFNIDISDRAIAVKEGEELSTGRHTLSFVMSPMVHWPEVMLTYEQPEGILFSADAFGTFGALNGALFADEVDFDADYMNEARRYYTNIVGKYGPQTQATLKKAQALDIKMICPLHGFVWRKDIDKYIEKYQLWSSYTPEEKGVVIAYASIYGNTENAAEILACLLNEKGIATRMFDVSVTPAPYILSEAFRFSHLVLAAPTYNAGVFVTMESVLLELTSHNLQNRTVAFIENGSWAPASGKLMRSKLEALKNTTLLEHNISIRSSLKGEQLSDLEALAEAIAVGIKQAKF